MTVKKYWMAPDSYVCTLHNRAMIYDVRGKVYNLAGSESNALVEHVVGWPVMALANAATDQTKIDMLLRALVSAGVLTDDSARGKSAAPVTVEPIDMQVSVSAKTRVRPYHWILFAAAYAEAKYQLRFLKMHGAFALASQRKRRFASAASDRDRTIALAAIFRRMQGYIYSTDTQCLFDSLVLLNFLAYHRRCARMIVGVNPDSSHIHMWVQLGNTVLGVPPSSGCEYTPIYAN